MSEPTAAFVIDGLGGGGAERVVLTLAGAMAKEGLDVTIFSLRPDRAYPLPPDVRLVTLEDRYRGPFHRQTEVRRRARALDRAVAERFGERRIDLAISCLPMADRVVAASRRLGGAWMCLHGAVASAAFARKRGAARWFKRRQLRRTYGGRRLITVSEGLRRDMTEVAGARPERMVTIPNPFDLDRIRELGGGACPLEGERFLLHVGRFRPVKRHDRLFEAFRRSGYPGKLVLLGEGTEEETREVRRLCLRWDVEKRAIFEGFRVNPYPYIRTAEALVLSSDLEGFGNVLVEALALGTPAVSTNCPYGPGEILTGDLARGLSGLSAEALARCIDEVLSNPPAIRPEALERFSLRRVLAQYLALLAR